MKRILKIVPSRNYRSDYEPSIALIESIAKDGTDTRNGDVLTADEVLRAFLNGETVKVMSPFGQEVQWKVGETPTAYDLLDTYRGFEIGSVRTGQCAVYKNGETFSDHYLFSVPAARAQIDQVIASSFDQWFTRYKECRAEAGLTDEPLRMNASEHFRARRRPEDAVSFEAEVRA